MIDLGKIDTESRNNNSCKIDEMNAIEIVELINTEDEVIHKAINKQLSQIAKVVDIAASTLKKNGRIIYIGAGTSGRLGVLDAVECPPTFGVSDEVVVGLIAGGESAFVKAVEGAEDNIQLAKSDLMQINLRKSDFVIGVAASGRTPYVIGGLNFANQLGCQTASIAITFNSEIGRIARNPIEVSVGAEVITGSTRMKAGTAQKMILNMISTGAMVLNGKVYQNLMVDVVQSNQKLKIRAQNIVTEATGVNEQRAIELLEKAMGNAKVAIAIELTGYDYLTSKYELEKFDGSLTKLVNSISKV